MKHRPLVIVADYLADPDLERKVLGDAADLKALLAEDEATVAEKGADADVMLMFHSIKLSERSLARLEKCKGVIRVGVGFDNVDLQAAGNRGIVVCNVPDYGTEEVADHAILMLLAIARRLMEADKSVRAGDWNPMSVAGTPRLRGKTLGLIGCGRIGAATALRAKAFGMRVVFYDPYKPAGYEKALGLERCHRLEDLLPQTQFVSLHCPLTRETRHILNAKMLNLLPRGSYLINTARGPCVELAGLLAALESGRVAYAALDVLEDEPGDVPKIHQHPRLLLTPHAAFYSVEGYEEMRRKGAEEALRMVRGEPVRNPVNVRWLTNPRCPVQAVDY